jgi:hypothetical protein
VKTDDLVSELSRGVSAVRPVRPRLRLSAAAAAGLVASVVLLFLIFGTRADFSQAGAHIVLKGFYGLAAAAAATPFLLEVSRPSTSARHGFWPIGVFAVLNILIGLLVLAATPPEVRLHAWTGDRFPECLYRIPLLALPIAVALTFAVRGLGATRLTLAGSAIGGVSGSLAAIVYASCCPADSVLYVLSWYLASVLLCAGAGAILLSRALKW